MNPILSSSVSGGAFGWTNVLPRASATTVYSPGVEPEEPELTEVVGRAAAHALAASGAGLEEHGVDLHARQRLAVLVGDAAR